MWPRKEKKNRCVLFFLPLAEGCVKTYDTYVQNTRYCFLKRPSNLTENQKLKLNEVLKYDLKSVRAYLLKESFQAFWEYTSPYWAGWFLKKWCVRAMRSRLEPMRMVVGMLRTHEDLILNWFRANKEFSAGVIEALNNNAKTTLKISYGIRSFEVLKTKLFHKLGALPEPPVTHRFC
jgi:transposase